MEGLERRGNAPHGFSGKEPAVRIRLRDTDAEFHFLPRVIAQEPQQEALTRSEGFAGQLYREDHPSYAHLLRAGTEYAPGMWQPEPDKAMELAEYVIRHQGVPRSCKSRYRKQDAHPRLVFSHWGLDIYNEKRDPISPLLPAFPIQRPSDQPVFGTGKRFRTRPTYPATLRYGSCINELSAHTDDFVDAAHAACMASARTRDEQLRTFVLAYRRKRPSGLGAGGAKLKRALSFRGRYAYEQRQEQTRQQELLLLQEQQKQEQEERQRRTSTKKVAGRTNTPLPAPPSPAGPRTSESEAASTPVKALPATPTSAKSRVLPTPPGGTAFASPVPSTTTRIAGTAASPAKTATAQPEASSPSSSVASKPLPIPPALNFQGTSPVTATSTNAATPTPPSATAERMDERPPSRAPSPTAAGGAVAPQTTILPESSAAAATASSPVVVELPSPEVPAADVQAEKRALYQLWGRESLASPVVDAPTSPIPSSDPVANMLAFALDGVLVASAPPSAMPLPPLPDKMVGGKPSDDSGPNATAPSVDPSGSHEPPAETSPESLPKPVHKPLSLMEQLRRNPPKATVTKEGAYQPGRREGGPSRGPERSLSGHESPAHKSMMESRFEARLLKKASTLSAASSKPGKGEEEGEADVHGSRVDASPLAAGPIPVPPVLAELSAQAYNEHSSSPADGVLSAPKEEALPSSQTSSAKTSASSLVVAAKSTEFLTGKTTATQESETMKGGKRKWGWNAKSTASKQVIAPAVPAALPAPPAPVAPPPEPPFLAAGVAHASATAASSTNPELAEAVRDSRSNEAVDVVPALEINTPSPRWGGEQPSPSLVPNSPIARGISMRKNPWDSPSPRPDGGVPGREASRSPVLDHPADSAASRSDLELSDPWRTNSTEHTRPAASYAAPQPVPGNAPPATSVPTPASPAHGWETVPPGVLESCEAQSVATIALESAEGVQMDQALDSAPHTQAPWTSAIVPHVESAPAPHKAQAESQNANDATQAEAPEPSPTSGRGTPTAPPHLALGAHPQHSSFSDQVVMLDFLLTSPQARRSRSRDGMDAGALLAEREDAMPAVEEQSVREVDTRSHLPSEGAPHDHAQQPEPDHSPLPHGISPEEEAIKANMKFVESPASQASSASSVPAHESTFIAMGSNSKSKSRFRLREESEESEDPSEEPQTAPQPAVESHVVHAQPNRQQQQLPPESILPLDQNHSLAYKATTGVELTPTASVLSSPEAPSVPPAAALWAAAQSAAESMASLLVADNGSTPGMFDGLGPFAWDRVRKFENWLRLMTGTRTAAPLRPMHSGGDAKVVLSKSKNKYLSALHASTGPADDSAATSSSAIADVPGVLSVEPRTALSVADPFDKEAIAAQPVESFLELELPVSATLKEQACNLFVRDFELHCQDRSKKKQPLKHFFPLELRRVLKVEVTECVVIVHCCITRKGKKEGSKLKKLSFQLDPPHVPAAWGASFKRLAVGVAPDLPKCVLLLQEKHDKDSAKLVEKYMLPVWEIMGMPVEVKEVQLNEFSIMNALATVQFAGVGNIILFSPDYVSELMQILVRKRHVTSPVYLPSEADPVTAALGIVRARLGTLNQHAVHVSGIKLKREEGGIQGFFKSLK